MKVIFNLKNSNGIDNINTKNLKDKSGNNLSTNKLNSILSLIANKYLYSEYKTVDIHSEYFKKISPDYKLYLDYLQLNEVIITNNHYKVGVKSTGYMFTDLFKQYASIHHIQYDLKEEKPNKTSEYVIPIDPKVKKKLSQDFKSFEIIDLPILNDKVVIEPDIYDLKSYISNYYIFEKIKNGDVFYYWKTARLYTSFINCSKSTRRNNFSFNGDKLASLDIPSSFPLFLCIWCINKGIDVDDNDFIRWCSFIKQGRDVDNKSIVYKELRKYLNKIKDSDGHEKYDEELDVYTKRVRRYYSDSESKLEFQKWLNGKDKNNITNNVFRQYFPSIFNVADRSIYKMYDEIVKLETDFIMNKMVATIYSQIRGIKILTCHDEIYFQEKFKTQVTEIWKAGLQNLYDQLPVDKFDDDDIGIDLSDLGICDAEDIYRTNPPNTETIYKPTKRKLFNEDEFDELIEFNALTQDKSTIKNKLDDFGSILNNFAAQFGNENKTDQTSDKVLDDSGNI